MIGAWLALALVLGGESVGETPVLEVDGEVGRVAFDRSGRLLAVAGDGQVRLLRISDGRVLEDHDVRERIIGLALDGSRVRWFTDVFGPDAGPRAPGGGEFEATLAIGLANQRWLAAMSWRPGRGLDASAEPPDGGAKERLAIVAPHRAPDLVWQGVTRPAAIAAGKKVYAIGDLGVRVFEKGGMRHLGADSSVITTLAFDSRETHLAVGDVTGQIVVWNLARSARIAEVTAHAGAVRAVVVDAPRMLSAGEDGHLRVRDLSTPEHVLRDIAFDAPVTALAWNPSRSLVAVGLGGPRPRVVVLRIGG